MCSFSHEIKLQELIAKILDDIYLQISSEMEGFISRKELSRKILQLLEKFYKLVDEACKLHLSLIKERKNLQVYCHQGCYWCCYQMPEGIHTIEFIYLYHGIRKIKGGNMYMARLLDRCEHFLSTIKYSQGNSMLNNYFQKKRPCPFLNKSSGSCEVYSYRPLICRIHYSFSPPRFCHPEQKETWRRHIINIESSPIVKDGLIKLDRIFPFRLSQFLVPGILEFIINVMGCYPIKWK